jgi:methionyl-tRNA formyltransferase
VPQSGKATYAPPLKKENGRINWFLSAREIFNLIRGTYPWPGAYCYLNGEKLHIIKAKAENDCIKGPVGRIEQISVSDMRVNTGAGTLDITEVKPEGKKIMTAAAFVNGRHLRDGATFETL